MNIFNDVQARAQQAFPQLQVKFKDESTLMKTLGVLLFFNPSFMTDYTTTIGKTVYFPSQSFVKNHPVTAVIVLLHELSHIYNSQKKGSIIFTLLYSLPQSLVVIGIGLLFLVGWKLSLLALLFLAPIPAYFRMLEERQAYTISLYVANKLNAVNNLQIDVGAMAGSFTQEFHTSSYYFMWPFPSINQYFQTTLAQVISGDRPNYDSELYNTVDQVLLGP